MLLNKLTVALWSADEILCDFYLSALPIFVVFFFMNKYLHTLDENFKAAEKFEQWMISLGKNICRDDTNTSGDQQEKKQTEQKQITHAPKNNEVLDEVGFQEFFQKLSNEFIDLKNMYYRNSSSKINFRHF